MVRNSWYLASVELDELVERVWLGVSVLDHPEKVLEEHNLAPHESDGTAVVGAAGALYEHLEQRVAGDVGADEVPPPRLADVDGVKAERVAVAVDGGWLPRAARHGGGGGGATVASGGGEAAEGVPPLEHALELAKPAALSHLACSPSLPVTGSGKKRGKGGQ